MKNRLAQNTEIKNKNPKRTFTFIRFIKGEMKV
jgi:hypothetical protein